MSNESSGGSGKGIIVGIFGVAAIGVVAFALTRGGDKPEPQALSSPTATSEPGAGGAQKVSVELLFSTEKEAWIQESVNRFEREHPNIDVVTKGQGSLTAARALVDGKAKPVLWSPADHVALNLAADEWFQKHRTPLFPESGVGAPEPLVLTPLVIVAWEDRAKVLTQTSTLSWKRIAEVLSAPEGWKAVGGDPNWGLVRLGHTDPTRSNSGLQTLLLIAHDYWNKTSALQVSDIVDQGFQTFLKSIEAGVPSFGDSTGTFMRDMVLYGPSKYDFVVSYENLAIEQIPNAQGRWGNLRVYYPQPTMWSSHPVVILDGAWVTPEQRAAAGQLVQFLRSQPIQLDARRYGYRPADTSVRILDDSPDNPFRSASAYGIRVDVPQVVEPPTGPVIQNLIEVWSRLVKR